MWGNWVFLISLSALKQLEWTPLIASITHRFIVTNLELLACKVVIWLWDGGIPYFKYHDILNERNYWIKKIRSITSRHFRNQFIRVLQDFSRISKTSVNNKQICWLKIFFEWRLALLLLGSKVGLDLLHNLLVWIDKKCDNLTGATGLHLAIAYGNDELCQCIVECCVDVNIRAMGTKIFLTWLWIHLINELAHARQW